MPLLNRSTRINTEGCRIPELVMRNNDGKIKIITKNSQHVHVTYMYMYVYMQL